MPRRKPAGAAVVGKAAATVHRLSPDYLDDLLTDAGVPKNQRQACARDINQSLDFYNRRLARKNAPKETEQAESLRLVAKAARELYKARASLPAALLVAIEPDYRAYIRKALALPIVRATSRAAAAKELAERDPGAQWLADQTAALPQSAREDVERASRELLPRAGAPLPLDLILAALIEATDKAFVDTETRVSRASSNRRRTHWRNELAWSLKVIVMAYSPKYAGDERRAEDWAAVVLDTAKIPCPSRETNPRAFESMFASR